MDEHRLGLKPVYRRVWAPRGKTPLAWVRPRYRWLYVYGFVRPGTGESEFWLLPTVNAVAFSEVLGRFARLRGAGEGKLLLLVLDRAGWHVSGRVEVPEGVRLVFLPPYSPELQPVERVWPLVNEAVANRYFRDLRGDDGGGGRAVPGPCPGPRDPQAAHPVPLVAQNEGIRIKGYQEGFL
ncbi:IS630 family transposase [Thermus thermophilus]|uniref:IS630 family transposase n=1 Tax=Thermus thermophilus TaxID=274 RepID=UPI001CC38570|nr:IS630 family transposase [Thermus thermophilus]